MFIKVLTLSLLYFINTIHAGELERMIVNGTEAAEGRYPYQTIIFPENAAGDTDMCGGTLIAPNWVLSAAHCFQSKIPIVYIGMNNIDTYDNFEFIDTIRVIKHPDYVEGSFDNDVMLIELKSNAIKSPVKLYDGTSDLSPGADVTVMGFGANSFDFISFSTTLLEVELDIYDYNECAKVYDSLTPNMICAYRQNKDVCFGDSGGPLIKKGNTAAEDVQVGIVSFDEGCAKPGIPGVYANLGKYIVWIESFLKVSCKKSLTERLIKLFD